jgi:hypothetical protein
MTSLLYSLVLLALPLCLALFDDKSGVIQLDASNFDQRVIKNEVCFQCLSFSGSF